MKTIVAFEAACTDRKKSPASCDAGLEIWLVD
jgi:hypothetical protein